MDYPAGIRPSGNSIEIRYQYKGKRYSETVEKRPNKTNIAYAAKLRDQRLTSLKHGAIIDHKSNPTFGMIAQDYLNTAKLEPSSRTSYRDLLNKYWADIGTTPIRSITYDALWGVDNATEWPSAKTRKNAITALRQVFRLAKKRGLTDKNPAAEMEQEKHQKPEKDPFSATEKATILDNLEGQAKSYFTLAFETGARTGELLALTWDDFEGKTLAINKSIVRGELKHTTKTHQAREVLLTTKAKEAILALPSRFQKENLFVIETVKGGPYMASIGKPFKDADHFNRHFKAACKTGKIPERRAYNCRHTYASLGLMAGAKPGFLANQLGHSLKMFFESYAKWMNSDDDDTELAKLEKWG